MGEAEAGGSVTAKLGLAFYGRVHPCERGPSSQGSDRGEKSPPLPLSLSPGQENKADLVHCGLSWSIRSSSVRSSIPPSIRGLTVRTRDLVWRSYVVFFCCVVRRKRTLVGSFVDFHSRGSSLTEREGIPLYTWNTAISRWIENREEGFFSIHVLLYMRGTHVSICFVFPLSFEMKNYALL